MFSRCWIWRMPCSGMRPTGRHIPEDGILGIFRCSQRAVFLISLAINIIPIANFGLLRVILRPWNPADVGLPWRLVLRLAPLITATYRALVFRNFLADVRMLALGGGRWHYRSLLPSLGYSAVSPYVNRPSFTALCPKTWRTFITAAVRTSNSL
jgi:hypothetical protein